MSRHVLKPTDKVEKLLPYVGAWAPCADAETFLGAHADMTIAELWFGLPTKVTGPISGCYIGSEGWLRWLITRGDGWIWDVVSTAWHASADYEDELRAMRKAPLQAVLDSLVRRVG